MVKKYINILLKNLSENVCNTCMYILCYTDVM